MAHPDGPVYSNVRSDHFRSSHSLYEEKWPRYSSFVFHSSQSVSLTSSKLDEREKENNDQNLTFLHELSLLNITLRYPCRLINMSEE